ncbi:hypothetical protein D3C87_1372710 [compost metagenome]
MLEHVQLENYCDSKHGFLKIAIEKTPFNFSIKGEYYTLVDNVLRTVPGQEASLFDSFKVDLTGR